MAVCGTTGFSCICLPLNISNHDPEAAEDYFHADVTPVCNKSCKLVEQKRAISAVSN